MINIFVPSTDRIYYFRFQNWILGPYTATGLETFETIEFRPQFDLLDETRGIYGENSVTNSQGFGYLEWAPAVGYLMSTPSARNVYPYYPNRVTCSLVDYKGFNPGLVGIYGAAALRDSSYYLSTATRWFQSAIGHVDGYTVVYVLGGSGTKVDYATKFKITSISYNTSGNVALTWDTSNAKITLLGMPPFSDGLMQQPAANIIGYMDAMTWNAPSHTTSSATAYHVGGYIGVTPQVLKVLAEVALVSLNLTEFKGEKANYGELAMKASEKANNSVNMLAFLRDFRAPLSMIPKLRNLRNLSGLKTLKGAKGLADDYLSVHYGVMPTISDLKAILAYFQRVAPFLDRNGFQVLTAASTASEDQGDIHLELEQHLKMAIAAEDSELLSIVDRIESFGVLPTLENLWDLIPYSFVIDWFADVGGFLERVDTRLRMSRQDIRYVTMSETLEVTKYFEPSLAFPLSGELTWRTYHRWVSGQCPRPPLILSTTFRDFDHWLESGALLMQRAK